jgi:transketolase C-terminal domain/subunit
VAQLLTAAALLQPLGIECSIYSVMSLKPIDREGLLDVIARHGAVITVEEHVATGGLGSALADLLLDAGILPRRLARLSLPDRFSSIVGGQDYLRRRHGLDAEAIAARARELVER